MIKYYCNPLESYITIIIMQEEKQLNSYNFSEKDWKLYRSKIAGWQEAYMEILRADEIGSERFWKLHDRIKEDKRSPGVLITRNSRSNMIDNILVF